MDAVSGMQQKILRYIQRTLDERGGGALRAGDR